MFYINSLFNRIKNKWYYFVPLIILCALYFYGSINYKVTKFEVSLLVPNDSLQATPPDLLNHNTNLISTLQERESWSTNSISSEQNGILQTRSIYIGIVSIILSFMLGKKEQRKAYLIFMLVLISGFFALDIHLEDLLDRNVKNRGVSSEALEILINQPPTADTWYDLNYEKRNRLFEELNKRRHPRKIHNAFNLII